MKNPIIVWGHGVQSKSSAEIKHFYTPSANLVDQYYHEGQVELPKIRHIPYLWADQMDLPGTLAIENVLDVAWYDKKWDMFAMQFAMFLINLGQPVIVVGHSLMTVLTMDAIILICRLKQFRSEIQRMGFFPVLDFFALASPLGVDVPILPGDSFVNRAAALERLLEDGHIEPDTLRSFHHYYGGCDPVATGGIFGREVFGSASLEVFDGYRVVGAESHCVKVDGYFLAQHSNIWTHPLPMMKITQHANMMARS